jgi:hypothetical protein
MELTFEEMDSEQSDFLPRREVMCCPCPPPPCYSPCAPSIDLCVNLCVAITL